MSVNIIPGSVFTTSLNVTSNASVGGNMSVGGNVNISGNLIANNVNFNPPPIVFTSPSNTLTISSNILGTNFTVDVSIGGILPDICASIGSFVSSLQTLSGPISLTSGTGSVAITTVGNNINLEATAGGVAQGTSYGDYLFWNPSTGTYVVGSQTVHIGASAGYITQGSNSVAIGNQAGQSNQGQSSIAVGYQSGNYNQQSNSTAVGSLAGNYNQRINSTAIGYASGNNNQGENTVAVGIAAGSNSQKQGAVSVGANAGKISQNVGAIAVGFFAGASNQGSNSVAIGSLAGQLDQAPNTIILNATGISLNAATAGLYVKPIRTDLAATIALAYNVSTGEITYNTGIGTGNWAGYPATSNIDVNGYTINSSSGNIGIIGDTTIRGLGSASVVGSSVIVQNDSSIPVAPFIALGYDRVKIQAWGGGGGDAKNGGKQNIGGAGGYLEYTLSLTSASFISVSVGGAGGHSSNTIDFGVGGRYGNGRGSVNAGSAGTGLGGGGGGGATIIRTANGLQSITAGGGGAGTNNVNAYGGNGGGDIGANGVTTGTGYGRGANLSSGGAGGSSAGFVPGTNGLNGANVPTDYQSGGPSIATSGYRGGGGGGGGWAGGGGGTATAPGGGGSSYVTSNASNVLKFAPITTPGTPPYTSPLLQNVASNELSGGVILTFYNSLASFIGPALTVANGGVQAPEFNSFVTVTPKLERNASADPFSFSNTPGVYQCVSYSEDDYGYITTSTVSVTYCGQAFITLSANKTSVYPYNDLGLCVSITSPKTYTITNRSSNALTDLSNVVTKYTKIG